MMENAYLSATLNNIKWTDYCMRETASENASKHTLGVVGQIMDVTHISALFM